MRAAGGGRGRGGACLHAGAGGAAAAAAAVQRPERAAIDAGRGAAGGAGRALRLSPPRGRVRAVVACRLSAVRRAGVSPRPRAPGGGGEPRAARPRAHAPARSASAPPRASPPRPRRRARSLAVGLQPPAPERPRLRPVFLWARQREGTVQEVRCEDYDPRNRIRIARIAGVWRVIPRTEIYNSIQLPPPTPPPEPKERRRRGRPRRRREPEPPPPPLPPPPAAWLAPDLESHIPSHTIAVPRTEAREPSPPHAPLALSHAEPTPLDNLLAVAELEFNQQRGEELELELQATAGAQYAFLPDEEVARDVMSFELGEAKADGMFYERKSHAPERAVEDDNFQNDMVVHKDLFETISEAHYLPELVGPHDEALLESLVEKGCEDNQILGQALDKFAHLVHSSGDYVEEEEDILLSGAPVADIIDRLEQSLESPGRSSITAAQGLLHLHHIGDHLNATEHQQSDDQSYISDDVFDPQTSTESNMETLNLQSDIQDTNNIDRLEYGENTEKKLQSDIEGNTNIIYTESAPDKRAVYENVFDEHHPQILPNQSQTASPTNISNEDTENCEHITSKSNIDINKKDNSSLVPSYTEKIMITTQNDNIVPTDLSVKHEDTAALVIESAAEISNHTEDSSLSDKSDDQPKDLSVHRRTPHESPRAPSRESDAMQSPQPSGIPALPSSPEIFIPPTKSKQDKFLETLLSSPSPKMYTSEVTISKQPREPINLGKHRKSASPTVSSCTDEIRKNYKEYGEPQEKRLKNGHSENAKVNKTNQEDKSKKPARKSDTLLDDVHPVKQVKALIDSTEFNLPDPLLIPKDKLQQIVSAPKIEIPALLLERPELRIPEVFAYPEILHDPNILVISVKELLLILEDETSNSWLPMLKLKDGQPPTPAQTPPVKTPPAKTPPARITAAAEHLSNNVHQPDQTNSNAPHRPTPAMDALAGDIDAATSAALNQMVWLPYLSQMDVFKNSSSQLELLKFLNSSGYAGSNYELAQMFGAQAGRFMGPAGYSMMPPMDYESRMQFAMWQETMNQSNVNVSASQRAKANSTQLKEMASNANDVQNPYVHSTKNSLSKSHTSARTSPIAPNYNNGQRSMAHNPYLQAMYTGMNPNMRPNMQMPFPMPPYFNPNMMNQRSTRMRQQKSPTAPVYHNNNYLQSVKHSEGPSRERRNSSSSPGSHKPRITLVNTKNLMADAVSPSTSSAMNRRRDEPEVGSTTPGEPPLHMAPHPHDPSSLWHPLFSNQKGHNLTFNWTTTVPATGD